MTLIWEGDRLGLMTVPDCLLKKSMHRESFTFGSDVVLPITLGLVTYIGPCPASCDRWPDFIFVLKNLNVVISGVSTALNGEFHFILHCDISNQTEAFVEPFTMMSI